MLVNKLLIFDIHMYPFSIFFDKKIKNSKDSMPTTL